MIGGCRSIFRIGSRESERVSMVDKSLVEVNTSPSEGDNSAEGEFLACCVFPDLVFDDF